MSDIKVYLFSCKGTPPLSSCKPEDEAAAKELNKCGLLKLESGQFKKAVEAIVDLEKKDIVKLKEMLDSCVFDVCQTKDDPKAHCSTLEEFLIALKTIDSMAKVDPSWRRTANCRK